jgi:hypothetical protein
MVDVYRFSYYLGTMSYQKAEVIRACLAMIVSIVLFLVLYGLFHLFTALWLRRISRRRLKPAASVPTYMDENKTWLRRNDKPLAAVAGFCSAVIATMVLTSPLMGVADVAGRVCDLMTKTTEAINVTFISEQQKTDIKKYSQNIPGNIFYQFGGKYMISAVAQGQANGETVYFFREVEAIETTAEALFSVLPILKDPAQATSVHQEQLDLICKGVDDIKLAYVFFPNFVSSGAKAWLKSNSYWGVAPPATTDVTEPIWDEVLSVCKTTDLVSVKTDLKTLLKVFQIFLKNNVFEWNEKNIEYTLSQIVKKDLVVQLNAELSQNYRMTSAGEKTTDLVMRPLAQQIKARKRKDTTGEKYAETMAALADAMRNVIERQYSTNEEKYAAYAISVKQHLGGFGVSLPIGADKVVAEVLFEQVMGGTTEQLAKQIAFVIESYM